MKAKRIIVGLLLLLLFLSGCSQGQNRGEVVNIYNWGSYIDKDLLRKFEEETGITVIYSNFNTNEDMYVKLKSGGTNYDVVVPSDYMIERLIKDGMLRKINWQNVPNIKYVDAEYLNHVYDPHQEYSAPFFWGTLGIIYNTTLVDDVVDSWGILWDEKYSREIIMLDSSRDSLGIALKYLGYSMNSVDSGEMEQAKELLEKQYPLVYAYLVDQTRDVMINAEAALAVIYSGDAMDALSNNEDLEYIIPKEGSNLWFDAMVIPAGSKNPENAEAFINFMLSPENAAQNSEFVYYSIPSSAAKELLEEELRDSEVAYPPKNKLKELEVFRDPGPFIKVYDDLWQDVKNQ
ncbi:MAG: spermidine/putrescine ABC transporter substrate-binding protein [Tissierellia bacterium]|jgi:spermidine/putrescine transport system substrate-binding protein|nr:spermidine/putrescine ABC transporter substrate-binding protein [Tissierellia bacterium]